METDASLAGPFERPLAEGQCLLIFEPPPMERRPVGYPFDGVESHRGTGRV